MHTRTYTHRPRRWMSWDEQLIEQCTLFGSLMDALFSSGGDYKSHNFIVFASQCIKCVRSESHICSPGCGLLDSQYFGNICISSKWMLSCSHRPVSQSHITYWQTLHGSDRTCCYAIVGLVWTRGPWWWWPCGAQTENGRLVTQT